MERSFDGKFGIIGRLQTEHFILAGLLLIGDQDLQIIILGNFNVAFGHL